MSLRKLPPGELRRGSRQHQVWRIVNAYAEARYRVGERGAVADRLTDSKLFEYMKEAARLKPLVHRALLATTAAEVDALVIEAGLAIHGYA